MDFRWAALFANPLSDFISAAKRMPPHRIRHQRNLAATVLACLAGSPALGEAAEISDDQAVIELQEPTAPLRWFQLSDWYEPTLYGEEGNINQLVFRTVLPFTIHDEIYLTRFTQQCTVSATSGRTGCLDPELILVRIFNEAWGRWGLGVDVMPPTGAENMTSSKWSVGPVLGFATSSAAPVQYGLYVRTYWSVAGNSSPRTWARSTCSPCSASNSVTGRRCRSAKLSSSMTPWLPTGSPCKSGSTNRPHGVTS